MSETEIVFCNTSGGDVEVLWELEGGGAEQHYFHLEGGKKFPTYRSQQTYAGHSWIVRRAGEILLRFTARNEPTMDVIFANKHPTIIFTISRLDDSEGDTGITKTQQVPPGDAAVIDTHTGHFFMARHAEGDMPILFMGSVCRQTYGAGGGSGVRSCGCGGAVRPYEWGDVCGFEIMWGEGAKRTSPGVTEQLAGDLEEVCRIIPRSIVQQLQTKTKIYINESFQFGPPGEAKIEGQGACVHSPHGDWLVQNGNDSCKKGCVEVYCAKHYVEWIESQPAMLLHELSHVWHNINRAKEGNKVDDAIQEAYKAAMSSGKYEEVLRWGNGDIKHRHYACTNHEEYFAKTSEAFWSSRRFRSDFFPFTRNELASLDPLGAALCEKVWGVSQEQAEVICTADSQ